VQVPVGLFRNSPRSPAFPPRPPPLKHFQPCSAPSSVLCRCLTSPQRSCRACGHRPSPTPLVHHCLPETMEISRFSSIECPRMHRVSDSAGPGENSLSNAILQCCLPPRTTRSASRMGDFGAQWLACVFPCQLPHVWPRGYPHMTRGHNGAASPFM
jgi:hypothetical protein